MNSGGISVESLIAERFALRDAATAYYKISDSRYSLAILSQCSADVNSAAYIAVTQRSARVSGSVNAGSMWGRRFSKAILLPALAKTLAQHCANISRGSATSHHVVRIFDIGKSVTDFRLILDDKQIDIVCVLVVHRIYGRMVCEALEAGKHVF